MPSNRDPSWRLRGFARVMRHEPSKAEAKLWEVLRDRKLGGFKFRRQVPIAGYIVDFYCPARQIVIEIDGESHFSEQGKQYDQQRDAYLQGVGLRVLRFTNTQVMQELEGVFTMIQKAVNGADE